MKLDTRFFLIALVLAGGVGWPLMGATKKNTSTASLSSVPATTAGLKLSTEQFEKIEAAVKTKFNDVESDRFVPISFDKEQKRATILVYESDPLTGEGEDKVTEHSITMNADGTSNLTSRLNPINYKAPSLWDKSKGLFSAKKKEKNEKREIARTLVATVHKKALEKNIGGGSLVDIVSLAERGKPGEFLCFNKGENEGEKQSYFIDSNGQIMLGKGVGDTGIFGVGDAISNKVFHVVANVSSLVGPPSSDKSSNLSELVTDTNKFVGQVGEMVKDVAPDIKKIQNRLPDVGKVLDNTEIATEHLGNIAKRVDRFLERLSGIRGEVQDYLLAHPGVTTAAALVGLLSIGAILINDMEQFTDDPGFVPLLGAMASAGLSTWVVSELIALKKKNDRKKASQDLQDIAKTVQGEALRGKKPMSEPISPRPQAMQALPRSLSAPLRSPLRTPSPTAMRSPSLSDSNVDGLERAASNSVDSERSSSVSSRSSLTSVSEEEEEKPPVQSVDNSEASQQQSVKEMKSVEVAPSPVMKTAAPPQKPLAASPSSGIGSASPDRDWDFYSNRYPNLASSKGKLPEGDLYTTEPTQ
ncbi:MAG: hypothetical protein WCT20_00310 [Candidatus Babeliales bacterium]